MTAVEKAKELVRKCWDLGGIDVLEAKQCALIAVDEILKAIPNYEDIEYWHAVKQELLKL